MSASQFRLGKPSYLGTSDTLGGAATIEGTATLSGGGDFTAQGQMGGAVVLSGGGDITAAGRNEALGTATLSGGGTLSGAGRKQGSGGTLLTGSGTITAGGRSVRVGTVTLSGSGDFTAVGSAPPTSGLYHEFTTATGQRYLPDDASGLQLLGGFTALSESPGGFTDATGEISKAEFDANPNVYIWGTWWRIYDQSDGGRLVWAGRLTDPKASGGTVTLHAEGNGKLADKVLSHNLWQTRDESRFTPADSDPFGYDTDPQIAANINGRSLVFRVKRKEVFKRGSGGNPSSWSTGAVFWVPTVNLSRLAFEIEKDRSSSEYDIQVLKATGPSGALSVVSTHSLAAGAPTDISVTLTGNPDLVMIRMRRQSETDRARAFKVKIKNIRINGPFTTADNYPSSSVMADIAAKLGASASGITTTTTNALPLDVEDASLGAIADELAMLDDYHWGLDDSGTQPNFVYRPYSTNVWDVTDTHVPVDLLPQERFNKVRVPYRYPGGVRDWVVKTASPDPLSGSGTAMMQVDLDDPLPPKEIAEAFATNIAAYLSQARMTGTATLSTVSQGGTTYRATRVRAGDTLRLTNYGNIELRVARVEVTDEVVQVSFATGHPLLERIKARRSLLLARGRSNAYATLEDFDLERPSVPGSVTLAFKEAEKRQGRRRFHAVLDWAAVTTDIEGSGTAIQRYVAEFRPVDSSGTPIPESQGGGIHRVVVDRKNLDDPATDNLPTKAILRNLEHPRKWRWQGHVLAVDVLGEKSYFSAWTPYALPASFGPPAPTALSLDIDQHWGRASWEAYDPDEIDDDFAPSLDHRISHFKYRVKKAGVQVYPSSGWKRVGRRNEVAFRVHKPKSSTYQIEVKSVDAYGNESSIASASNVRGVPPTPWQAPTISQTDGGKELVTMNVTVPGQSSSQTDDDVVKIAVRFQHKRGSSPTDSDPKDWASIDIDPDDIFTAHTARFKNIKEGKYCRASYRFVDADGKKSGWSPWSSVVIADDPTTPPVAYNVTVDKNVRQVIVSWLNNGDNQEVAESLVELSSNGWASVLKSKRVKGTEATFKVPQGSGNVQARVTNISQTNKSSSPGYSGSTITPDQVQESDMADNSISQRLFPTSAGIIRTGWGGSVLSDMATNLGTVTAGELRGAIVRTANSGARIEMKDPSETGAGNNARLVFHGTSQKRGHITAEGGNFEVRAVNGADLDLHADGTGRVVINTKPNFKGSTSGSSGGQVTYLDIEINGTARKIPVHAV